MLSSVAAFQTGSDFTLVDETAGYAPCGLQKWIDAKKRIYGF